MIQARIQIALQDLAKLLGDGKVSIGLVEPEYSLETDRFEIAFGLRLFQRIGVDEFAIDTPAVLTEGGGRELDDG